jgi:hypothetical protein
MSPNADSDEQSSRQPLPFEPSKRRKPASDSSKSASKPTPVVAKAVAKKQLSPDNAALTDTQTRQPATLEESRIPEIVSRRMLRRMALLCGIPSFLGMFTFLISYFLVTQAIVALPTYVVMLVSLGFLGLGVLGLSYGVLSASWDEEVAGSWLGWSEFTTNLGRMTGAWRSDKSSN